MLLRSFMHFSADMIMFQHISAHLGGPGVGQEKPRRGCSCQGEGEGLYRHGLGDQSFGRWHAVLEDPVKIQ